MARKARNGKYVEYSRIILEDFSRKYPYCTGERYNYLFKTDDNVEISIPRSSFYEVVKNLRIHGFLSFTKHRNSYRDREKNITYHDDWNEYKTTDKGKKYLKKLST